MQLEEALRRFAQMRDTYRAAAEHVTDVIREVAAYEGISCILSARAKDLSSFRTKVFVRDYDDAWEQVTDKAGARAIVSRGEDIDALSEAIRRDGRLPILRVEDSRLASANSLSYSGYHVQLQCPEFGTEAFSIECELQIRTSIQNEWSTLSHRLLYKPEVDLPLAEQRSLYRLLALVELYDSEVDRVYSVLSSEPEFQTVLLLDFLASCYKQFSTAVGSRELSIDVLKVIAPGTWLSDQWKVELRDFIKSHDSKIKSVIGQGTIEGAEVLPDYILFSQAEILLIMHQLTVDATGLLERWYGSDLPPTWLNVVARRWGLDEALILDGRRALLRCLNQTEPPSPNRAASTCSRTSTARIGARRVAAGCAFTQYVEHETHRALSVSHRASSAFSL